MGNLGGAELLVIFVIALVVLGPTRLPEAARQIGKAVTELRRVSGGFQRELREALHEPLAETEAILKGQAVTDKPPTGPTEPPEPNPPTAPTEPPEPNPPTGPTEPSEPDPPTEPRTTSAENSTDA